MSNGESARKLAREKLSSSLSATSRKTYIAAFDEFVKWSEKKRVFSFPCTPALLSAYIAHLAKLNYKRNTMQFKITAIAQIHLACGFKPPSADPSFKRVWDGIRRSSPNIVNSATPLTIDKLRLVIDQIGNDLRGLRDRAILLCAFAGALKQVEICRLTRDKITFDEYMILDIHGPRPRQVFIGPGLHSATCPVYAMREWLEIADIKRGPVFRGIDVHGRLQVAAISSEALHQIIISRCRDAGLKAGKYCVQSLRSGFYRSARDGNVDVEIIARHAGIRDVENLQKKHMTKENWLGNERSIDSAKWSFGRKRHD